MLGECFGGATAFPQGRGVWRDDARGEALVFDEPVVIQCYTAEALIEQQADRLKAFLVRMGTDTNQGAVGLVIDRDYLEIGFRCRRRVGRGAMAKNIDAIAAKLGATVVAEVPDTGPGAFGAAKLAEVAAALRSRMVPGEGKRPAAERPDLVCVLRRSR